VRPHLDARAVTQHLIALSEGRPSTCDVTFPMRAELEGLARDLKFIPGRNHINAMVVRHFEWRPNSTVLRTYLSANFPERDWGLRTVKARKANPEARKRYALMNGKTSAESLRRYFAGEPQPQIVGIPETWETDCAPIKGDIAALRIYVQTGQVIVPRRDKRSALTRKVILRIAEKCASREPPKRVKPAPTEPKMRPPKVTPVKVAKLPKPPAPPKEPKAPKVRTERIVKPVDEKAAKARKTRNGKTLYLTNDFLLEELRLSHEKGQMTDGLGKAFMLLADKISWGPRYRGYSYREDLVGTAIITLCKNWRVFNPEKGSNPFAYFTTAVTRSFLHQMHLEREQSNIKSELATEMGGLGSWNYENDKRLEAN
jgi:hypothetical protein